MNDAEIYTVNPPAETIVVVPREWEFIYDQDSHGGDVLGVLFQDKRVGHVFMALTPLMAIDLFANLNAMIHRLDELRHEHEQRNKP